MSTRHALGFTRHRLRLPFGRAVALHVWRHGRRDASTDRHDHQYGFVSIPLIGRFLDERWREEAVHECGWYVKRSCVSSRVAGSCQVGTEEQRVDLWPLQRRVRYPMLPWSCPPEAIHSLTPVGDGLHVSLVFQGPLVRDTSSVWRTT